MTQVYTVDGFGDLYETAEQLPDVEKRGTILAANDRTDDTEVIGYRTPLISENESVVGDVSRTARRLFYEPRFRHDFNNIRIYQGRQATELCNQFNARAFTYGRESISGQENSTPTPDPANSYWPMSWHMSFSKAIHAGCRDSVRESPMTEWSITSD